MNNADMPINPSFDKYGKTQISDSDLRRGYVGLTKREEFARTALQGMAASDSYSEASWEQIAEAAVTAADALLAELDK
jgi:hypothetical protein